MNERVAKIFFGVMLFIVVVIGALVAWNVLNSRAPVTVSGYRWERTYRLEQFVEVEDWVLRGDPVPEGAANVREVREEIRVPLSTAEIGQGACEDVAEDLTIVAYECDITRFTTFDWEQVAPVRFVEENRDIDTFQPPINTCETPETGCQRIFDFTSTRFWVFLEDRRGDVHDCRVGEGVWREIDTGRQFGEVRFFDDELVCESVPF